MVEEGLKGSRSGKWRKKISDDSNDGDGDDDVDDGDEDDEMMVAVRWW